MLCRQLIRSLTSKRCFHFSVHANNVTCAYPRTHNNFHNLGYSINYNVITNSQHNVRVIKRFKYNKKPTTQAENEESDDEDYDIPEDKHSPVLSLKVNSLRVDLVLKAGLNIARNKIETAFYESKIRINGKKVFKKSEQLRIGDEVDLIRGPSPMNPNFLVVSRISILNAKENSDSITIKLNRNKSLVIENYDNPVNTESNT